MNGQRINLVEEIGTAFSNMVSDLLGFWLRSDISTRDKINSRHEEFVRDVNSSEGDKVRTAVSNNQFIKVNQDRVRLALALESEAFVLEKLAATWDMASWLSFLSDFSQPSSQDNMLPNITMVISSDTAAMAAAQKLNAENEGV